MKINKKFTGESLIKKLQPHVSFIQQLCLNMINCSPDKTRKEWLNYLKIPLDLKIIFNDQNNYVERSNWLLDYRNILQYCLLCLSFPHNYFDPTELFSDLYLHFFNILAKIVFSV